MYEIKSLFLPFNTSRPTTGVVGSSCLIASEHNSYIEGAYYHQTMPLIAGEGITLPGDYLLYFEQEALRECELSESFFRALVSRFELPFKATSSSSTSGYADWRDMTSFSPNNIGEYARIFDLSLIERSVDDHASHWRAVAENLILDSGRPVMVVGSQVPNSIGKRVVIAWNGSVESVRALIASRPFLEKCEELVILQVEGGMVPGPNAMEIAKSLEMLGINGKVESIDSSGLSVGRSVLTFAEEYGCDLLIKGAFTQSRLRQMLFGGPTTQILEEAPMPVLFCN
ncbi:MAG: hypothetical protein CL398_00730 [Acidiferrobacteraceae bacterium]|nr:hypothetical protein [Acidiferrobacteraceae bacterium]